MKIIVIGALPESLINFRGELITKLVKSNHDVIAMAAPADQDTINRIEQLGCRYEPYPIARNNTNPGSDLKTLIALIKVYKKEQPDKVIAYTIKPVIWGGISALFFPAIQFNALITGLGFAFQGGNLKRTLIKKTVTTLYKLSLMSARKVIFQNQDNMLSFLKNKIVHEKKAFVINGSGVNLAHFKYSPLPNESDFTFLTIARLLGDKGLREYAAAAEIVLKKHPKAKIQILGPEDPSPDGIKLTEVHAWQEKGLIEYLGSTRDVRPFISKCHVFVLASYHEGLPRTVIEAMAIGRPILTTNVPGCRDTVEEGVNGFLVEKANAEQLAKQMIWFIENQSMLVTMANKSLAFAENKYDVNKVNHDIYTILDLHESKND